MSSVFKALAAALRDLIRFKIAWIIIWPFLVSIIFWVILGYVFEDHTSALVFQVLNQLNAGEWVENIESSWIAKSILGLIHLLAFIPLVVVTTLLITSIFVMPALVNLVAKRNYPDLTRMYGGSVTGSVINAILASGAFALIWIVTMPLWSMGVGVIIPFIAAAFMNQQLFRYDALSEHASKEEIKLICESHRYSLWGLGLLTGLIQFIPLLNFFAPIFTALAFIHFCLGHLNFVRSENKPKE